MTVERLYPIELALTLEAPFLFGANRPDRYGIDIAQIRDQDGRPIIPDTHVKGVLRHAWACLDDQGHIPPLSVERAFGKISDSHKDERGRLLFHDLVASDVPGSDARIMRVSIDDTTGAAAEGQLLTVEEVAPVGEPIVFTGSMLARLGSETEAEEVRAFLETAFEAVAAMGRFKTVGYGALVEAIVTLRRPRTTRPRPQGPSDARDFAFQFSLDKSLLNDVYRADANALIGSEVIPGGVLKGALAEKLRSAGEMPEEGVLGEALSSMVIGHASPKLKESGEARNFSCVEYDKRLRVWSPSLELSGNKDELPVFEPDRTDDPDERIARDVRTRVGIDAETGASDPGKLFTQSAVWPKLDGDDLRWTARIHWPGDAEGEDYQAFLRCLDALHDGLFSVGKLQAGTSGAIEAATQRAPIPHPAARYEVELLSPCLMIRERHLASEAVYSAAIALYWNKLGEGAWRLAKEPDRPIPNGEGALDFYCLQEMRGDHLALRYPYFGEDVVEPYVLALAGSVFRLEILDTDRARTRLEELKSTGLPVANWGDETDDGPGDLCLEERPDYWKCPFGPQQGYGHISAKPLEDGR